MRLTVRLGDYRFRPLTDSEEDTSFVLKLRNTPAGQAAFYSGAITRDDHLRFLKRPEFENEINWLVEKRGVRVGQCSIFRIDRKNRRAEVGRIAVTTPEAYGPIFTVWVYVAFEHLGLNKVYGETLASNTVSNRALERLGSVREGLLREHAVVDGVPRDVCIYGNVASEWPRLKPAMLTQFGEPQLIRHAGDDA